MPNIENVIDEKFYLKQPRKGWGKGETTAITANFKSVSAILAPALLAKAYNLAPGSGAPMLLCAAATTPGRPKACSAWHAIPTVAHA